MRFIPSWTGVAVALVLSVQRPALASSAPAPSAFRFDWSPPCRVTVLDNVEKDGKSTRMRYAVDVRPMANKEANLRVTLENFEFLRVEGTDVTGKEWQERLRPVVALASTIPAFEVTPEGVMTSVESTDAMIDRLSRFDPKKFGSENMRKMFASPTMKAVIDQAMLGYWSGWVGTWVGWPLKPGTDTREADVQQLPTGRKVPVTVLRRFDRFESGYAFLRQTVTTSGDSATQAVEGFANDITRAAGVAGLPADAMKNMKMEMEYSTLVETRPENLRPRRTRSEKRVTLTADGKRQTQVEIHDVAWDWAHAKGCKKR